MNDIMIILCIFAVGLALTAFAYALHYASDGHQDEFGFHADSKPVTRPRRKARSTKKRRSSASGPFDARHAAGMR